MCNYLQAIDWAGSRRRPAILRNRVCVCAYPPMAGSLIPSGSYLSSFFDAPYLRNGCPTEKSEQRKRGKGGGMCNYLQAIDWAGSRRRRAIFRNRVCVGHISPNYCGRLGPVGTD